MPEMHCDIVKANEHFPADLEVSRKMLSVSGLREKRTLFSM